MNKVGVSVTVYLHPRYVLAIAGPQVFIDKILISYDISIFLSLTNFQLDPE